MTLGEMIQQGRKKKRMTLRAVARVIGVSAPFMSDVEHNRHALTDERIEQVAKLLDLDVAAMKSVNGLTMELKAWIRDNPDLVAILHIARDMRRPIVIGGETCPCCNQRLKP